MDDHDGLTIPERIDALERAVAKARREMSVASFEYLAVMTIGNIAQFAAVQRRLNALGEIVDAAVLEIARLLVEQRRVGQEAQ